MAMAEQPVHMKQENNQYDHSHCLHTSCRLFFESALLCHFPKNQTKLLTNNSLDKISQRLFEIKKNYVFINILL